MIFGTKQTELDKAILAGKSLIKYLIVISCVANLLNLAMPLYTMQVYDRVLSSGSTDTLMMLVLVVVLALFFLAMVQIGRSFLVTSVGLWLEQKLSKSVFDQAIIYTRVTKNYTCDQALRDLKTIKSYIAGSSIITILDIPWSIIFVIVLFALHPYLGLLSVFSCIAMIVFAFISDRLTRSLLMQHGEIFMQSIREVEQSTQGVELFGVMGIQGNIVANWDEANSKSHLLEKAFVKRRVVIAEMIRCFRMLLQVAIIGLGAYVVLKYGLSSGVIIASSVLFGRAIAPFEQMIVSWREWISCKSAYHRLNAILKTTETKSTLVSSVLSSQITTAVPIAGIAVENLSFIFLGSTRHVLRGIRFAFDLGRTLVIKGSTASGKSVLGRLLAGILRPSIGAIKLNGVNLAQWLKNGGVEQIGYLSQQITLFNGTILANIARMDKKADYEMVVAAAQLFGIHDVILKLPNGYNTIIGTNGLFLAAGQQQLIALARAFYKMPPILILDDPTLYLDYHGKQLLYQVIEKTKEKRITMIIISNDRELIALADKVLVLYDGIIKVFGDQQDVAPDTENTMQQLSVNGTIGNQTKDY